MKRSSDESTSGRGSSVAVWTGIVALLLPVVYVLSLGPAVWLHDRGGLGSEMNEFIRLTYSPLAWLRENSEVCRHVLDWYVGLWGV